MYTYKITKKGRKWFQAEKVDGGYKAQIEINDTSKEWEVNSIVEFDGKFEKKVNYGHTKVFIYPCTEEQKEQEKEQKEIEKWLTYVENQTEYVYTNGVNNLEKYNLNQEQKIRLNKAIEIATINKNNQYVYYIEENIKNGKWYQKGEDTILKNCETYKINVSEYKEKIAELKKTYEEQKEAKIKLDSERYFYIDSLSYEKGDNYKIGEIIRNKDGKLGKVVKEWKYYENDTMSFGYMVDGGWLRNAKCDTEAVTQEEREEYLKIEEKAEEEEKEVIEEMKIKKEEKEVIEELIEYIIKNGVYPDNKGIKVEGEEIFNNFNIYGGGDRIVIVNNKIWAIRNNGADGDMWDRNNVSTGGAGAIGYYATVDEKTKELTNYIKKARFLK